MNKIMELRNKRNALWEQTKNYLEEHRGENDIVDAAAVEQYEKMGNDVRALGEEIRHQVAVIHNTTVDVVRAEIQKAIRFGQRSPAFRETFGGRAPSVDEYVQTIADIIMKKKG